MFKQALFVALGGSLGSVGRFLAQHYFDKFIKIGFPFSILLINIIGSFIIGFYHGYASDMTSPWRYFIAIGFCGGFTTFSTFAYENMLLLKNGNYLQFTVYTLLSVFLCIAFVKVGSYLGKYC